VAAAVPPATEGIGTVLMAGSLYTTVKVDASFNAILPGDLLTSSGTPGHAMKATAGTPAGTVIGKALERLDAGTGLIRILLMAR
jgi:hypothetical protein